jgi:hypothetical protein
MLFEPSFFIFEPPRDDEKFSTVEAAEGFVTWLSSSLGMAPDGCRKIKAGGKMVLK